MMKAKHLIFIICAPIIGCATPLKSNETLITFDSIPKGAMIYSNGKAIGMAPVTMKYTASVLHMQSGYISPDVVSVWASGTKSNTDRIRAPIGKSVTYTFSRPSDTPGLDVDMAFEMRMLEKKNDEQRRNSQAYINAMREMQRSQQEQNRTINEIMNNYNNKPVRTDCYFYGNSANCTSR
ncbi:MAG: hypothetical protein IPG66_10985 [Hydrogenophilales bacterium]|nr:hypothetical protein [Hydrogenophilales bacterium]